ncbi:hypothetical protein C467_13302 [Halorubrum hochstenium ATCC 700873]|uniref:Uncharacterized protein n=2 Tax=Haloferacaceae TaxID=1644056 RepID=M0F1X1_9EURY|nr:hypothetical protein C467_13302 [Halorubrum hochstenium ATCC 700873]
MLGMECGTVVDFLDGQRRLAGTRHEEPRPIGVSDVLELHSGSEIQICLNGDLVLKSDELTAEDIEESAKKALSEASETAWNDDSRCRN